ncbi:MAG: pH regulation protein F [Rhodobacteraceae bacterium]|nr:pH regulation protein F [Paracoccaceae bacterium]
MTLWLHILVLGLLASLAGALWRVWHGPAQSDRMMAAQLVGTGGVAVLSVLAALQDWDLLVVALALAVLAALAAVGFVKAQTPDSAGDPEETPPPTGGDRRSRAVRATAHGD